ncbi:hypothetical protein AVW15_17705 [Chelatococcus daeguensis]|nr:hypothetical protein AVW15_17705 [Chelatococcus daeguensis]
MTAFAVMLAAHARRGRTMQQNRASLTMGTIAKACLAIAALLVIAPVAVPLIWAGLRGMVEVVLR